MFNKEFEINYLNKLSDDEKSILRTFFSVGNQSIRLSGDTMGPHRLEEHNIIHQEASNADDDNSAVFTMSDWAWDYLQKNPGVIN